MKHTTFTLRSFILPVIFLFLPVLFTPILAQVEGNGDPIIQEGDGDKICEQCVKLYLPENKVCRGDITTLVGYGECTSNQNHVFRVSLFRMGSTFPVNSGIIPRYQQWGYSFSTSGWYKLIIECVDDKGTEDPKDDEVFGTTTTDWFYVVVTNGTPAYFTAEDTFRVQDRFRPIPYVACKGDIPLEWQYIGNPLYIGRCNYSDCRYRWSVQVGSQIVYDGGWLPGLPSTDTVSLPTNVPYGTIVQVQLETDRDGCIKKEVIQYVYIGGELEFDFIISDVAAEYYGHANTILPFPNGSGCATQPGVGGSETKIYNEYLDELNIIDFEITTGIRDVSQCDIDGTKTIYNSNHQTQGGAPAQYDHPFSYYKLVNPSPFGPQDNYWAFQIDPYTSQDVFVAKLAVVIGCDNGGVVDLSNTRAFRVDPVIRFRNSNSAETKKCQTAAIGCSRQHLDGALRNSVPNRDKITHISLYTLQGKPIQVEQPWQQQIFLPTNFAAGMYLYRLHYKDGELQFGKVLVYDE